MKHCTRIFPILTMALVGVGCAAGNLGQTGTGGTGTGGASGANTGGSASGGAGPATSSGGAIGTATGGSGSGGRTGTGGAVSGGTGGATTGSGGATTGSGGAGTATGSGGATVAGVLGPFTDDFEDGDLLKPATAVWKSAVRSDGDMAQWATITDGTKVVTQSLAADESELVSGDYRWTNVSIEAKVKHLTPSPRAGVCVRYKSQNEKWCVFLENLTQATAGATAQVEMRMRSAGGSGSSLPKIKTADTPGATVSLAGWNTLKLEVRGSVFTAWLNGVMMFTYTDSANLVSSGGVALATQDGAMASFDDVKVTPL